MEQEVILRERTWLNPIDHSDTGAISSEVIVEDYGVSADISIWDCSRKIDLSFYFDTKEGFRQRVTKIDAMITHFTAVKQALVEASKEAKERNWFDEEEESS